MSPMLVDGMCSQMACHVLPLSSVFQMPTITMTRRPLKDLRHAFELDDYPVEGLTSGEFHVYGNYLGPNGVGRLHTAAYMVWWIAFAAGTVLLAIGGGENVP